MCVSKCNVTDMSAVVGSRARVLPTVTAARSVSDIRGLRGVQGDRWSDWGIPIYGFHVYTRVQFFVWSVCSFSENSI